MTAQKVYVITSDGGPTKIGISNDPLQRCASLRSQFKDRHLSIAHVAELDGLKALAVERKAHQLLKEVRVHGEWFAVDTARAISAIDDAIIAVRNAGILDVPKPPSADSNCIHLRITLESSTKIRLEELSRSEKRSLSNLAGFLLEQYQREKEPTDEPR